MALGARNAAPVGAYNYPFLQLAEPWTPLHYQRDWMDILSVIKSRRRLIDVRSMLMLMWVRLEQCQYRMGEGVGHHLMGLRLELQSFPRQWNFCPQPAEQ